MNIRRAIGTVHYDAINIDGMDYDLFDIKTTLIGLLSVSMFFDTVKISSSSIRALFVKRGIVEEVEGEYYPSEGGSFESFCKEVMKADKEYYGSKEG